MQTTAGHKGMAALRPTPRSTLNNVNYCRVSQIKVVMDACAWFDMRRCDTVSCVHWSQWEWLVLFLRGVCAVSHAKLQLIRAGLLGRGHRASRPADAEQSPSCSIPTLMSTHHSSSSSSIHASPAWYAVPRPVTRWCWRMAGRSVVTLLRYAR